MGRPPLPPDIKELMILVRAGKLFAVQQWIFEGKRTVPPEPYWTSPLRVAIEKGFHSMVEVLLTAEVCQEEKDYMLQRSVWNSNFDLIQLLVQYGANLHSVRFDDVCRTGSPPIISFFLDRGLDAVTGQPFANALQHPQRPLLGIYMTYRTKIPELTHQVNLALRFHAQKGNLKWVCLLLWAGADPHVRLPDIDEESDPETDTTALEEAVWMGRSEVIAKIGIDPAKDDLNRLLEKACSAADRETIKKLLSMGANPNPTTTFPPMERLIFNLEHKIRPLFGSRSDYDLKRALEEIVNFAEHGGRWTPKETYQINGFRRDLYKLEPSWIEKIVHQFHEHSVCSSDVLTQLLSQPKMKQLLGPRFAALRGALTSQGGVSLKSH